MRINRAAQRLTLERGLDGFTMEDLAEASDVSRRTLFNYFPGKIDAVLGGQADEDIPPAALRRFVAGGPDGVLLDDLITLALAMLDSKGIAREDVQRRRELLAGEPRLAHASQQWFAHAADRLHVLVLEREGEAFGADRARLLFRIFVVAFETASERFADGDQRPIDEIFAEVMATMRDLLA